MIKPCPIGYNLNIQCQGGISLNSIFGITFTKQANMRRVLLSLIPIYTAAVYFFGWRVIALLFVNTIAGVLMEWLFKRTEKKPVSEAVFVSAALYTLILPPRTPFWVAAVGMLFGILFSKEVFGGFGRNVFNPALVARAFVYVSFPAFITGQWTAVRSGFPGGFGAYLNPPIDTLSTATPMLVYRTTGSLTDIGSLLWGSVSGSAGETSAALIILAGIYLLYTKTAFWENMLGVLVGFSLTTLVFNALGVSIVPPLMFGLLSGGLLFGTVFMITDPITSAKTREGKLIYGFLVGLLTVVIRGFALFTGGIMFSILIGNMFVPIIDVAVKSFKQARKAKGGAVHG